MSVLKFAAGTFARPEAYREIAGVLTRRVDAGDKVAVVVGARPGETERLRDDAYAVDPAPGAAALDGLVQHAGTVSAALLRVACERRGLFATVLAGRGTGFVSDSTFGNARLLGYGGREMSAALARYDVIVVAGGQATDVTGRPTYLGEHTADLSAVAVAVGLGADRVEICSDVPGVYDADPNLLAGARPLAALDYDSALRLASLGARVLHPRAVRLARARGVTIECRLNREPYPVGTTIGAGGSLPYAVVVAGDAVVVRCPDPDALTRAADALTARGVEPLLLPHDLVVAVPGGATGVAPILAAAGAPGRVTGEKLLSVIRDGQVVTTVEPALEAAVRRGQQLLDARPATLAEPLLVAA
ncbi:aspartate kinase [Actinoplanes octamycinicus]|uniref:aspartate kinase n=1 Tax=Actinoplanes octamycinicus TaxID=135948 RepID=A0A7W7GVZ5_9ACTN|nr:aspartate kinase [Actinoplanes octamycinicus]MBB4739162.1 aspartate kinase [Actinoplanes octamycinicus]